MQPNLRPRVSLNGQSLFIHYVPALLPATGAAVTVFGLLLGIGSPDRAKTARYVALALTAAAILLAWIKRRELRFESIDTENGADANYEKVIRAIEQTSWKILSRRIHSHIIARVPGAASWGERVELQFRGKSVYVNSICDPDIWPAITSKGGNSDNVRFIRSVLLEANETLASHKNNIWRKSANPEDPSTSLAIVATVTGTALLGAVIFMVATRPGGLGIKLYLGGIALAMMGWGIQRIRVARDAKGRLGRAQKPTGKDPDVK